MYFLSIASEVEFDNFDRIFGYIRDKIFKKIISQGIFQ